MSRFIWQAARACLVIYLAVALSGCSSEEQPIVLFTWTRPQELQANQELIEKFQQTHPEIHVQIANDPSDAAMTKLQNLFAAGDPPDIMSIHGAFFVAFAAKGLLLPLDELIAKDPEFNLDEFYPGLIDLCRVEGKLYSIPRYASVYTMFYNKELFDEAGLPYPDPDWTWDTFLEYAKALTVDTDGDGRIDQYGTIIDYAGARIYPWIWQNGGRITTPDRRRLTLDEPAAVQALEWVRDLRWKHHVCPGDTAVGFDDSLTSFASGKIGMYMSGPWDIQFLLTAEELDWDVQVLPRGKRAATMLGTENYAISATTHNVQAAWELFKFLMSPESQRFMAERLQKMPSRIAVAEEYFRSPDLPYNGEAFLMAIEQGVKPPNIPEWNEVADYIAQALQAIWSGKEKSVKKAMSRAMQQANAVLQRRGQS